MFIDFEDLVYGDFYHLVKKDEIAVHKLKKSIQEAINFNQNVSKAFSITVSL